jgi:hypothetical protein
MGQPIQIADLGNSTANFNFFVTQSVSHSISLSHSSSSSASSTSLMNKLISLSSEGKFSIIDSVIEKVSSSQKPNVTVSGSSSKTTPPQSSEKSSSYEIINAVSGTSTAKKGTTTQQFEIIEEEENEEEEMIEKVALENIKEIEEAEKGE